MPSDSLLERDAELARAETAIGDVAQGRGRILVAEGAGGIGKTTLLNALVERAEAAGLRTLRASGGELERDLGWKVVRELLTPLLAGSTEAERRRLFEGAAGLSASMLGYSAVDTSAAPRDQVASALHGLYWLTANAAAESPLLVVVDDAHWADPPSLRWLGYLAARAEGLPVLLALGLRPSDGGDGTEPLRDTLVATAARTGGLIELQPLGTHATAELMRSLLSSEADERFCESCHSATRGNPFLLSELARALAADGVPPTAENAGRIDEIRSDAIAHTVLVRLARLPQAALELATAVAVLGREARLHDAAALAGLDADTAAEAATRLGVSDVLRDGVPLEFVHPIVRSVVYEQLPAVQRARWHERAARALHAAAAPPGDIALHLTLVEPRNDQAVGATLVAAAEEAIAGAAHDTAATYLRRALEEPLATDARPHAMRLLGRAEVATTGPRGYTTLRSAFDESADPAERADIALELAHAVRMTGEFSKALEPLERALGAAEPDSALAFELEGELVGLAMLGLETLPLAAARMGQYAAEPGRARSATLVAALSLAALAGAAPLGQASALARRALEVDGARQPSVVVAAASVLAACDEFDAAAAVWDDFIDQARRGGSALAYAFACFHRADVNYRRGAVAAAEVDGRAAEEIYREWKVPLATPIVDALVERDVREAERVLAAADLPDTLPETWAGTWSLFSRARVRLAAGQQRGAADDLLECGRRFQDWGCVNPAVNAWRSNAAIALAACGDTAHARRLADEEVAAARAFGAPRAHGIALRAAGLVESAEGGTELLREAVDVLRPSHARLEYARALCDLGSAMRRSGQRRDAREPLREAVELASECGATLLAERARAELAATGAKPRRDALRGRDALTASELRVAQMAAEGLSNRDIAQALFVTQRTVETHLTHAYSKLDITSRNELAGALA